MTSTLRDHTMLLTVLSQLIKENANCEVALRLGEATFNINMIDASMMNNSIVELNVAEEDDGFIDSETVRTELDAAVAQAEQAGILDEIRCTIWRDGERYEITRAEVVSGKLLIIVEFSTKILDEAMEIIGFNDQEK